MAQKLNYTILLSAIFLLGFSSCGENEVAVTGVTLNKSTLELIVGETETLIATITPRDADNQQKTWRSSHPTIASIDANGRVVAEAPGTTTITVTTVDGAHTAICTVTVDNISTSLDGVVINGITWATRNVASSNAFASRAEDHGGYYTWEQAQNACPPGWRLPTRAEFDELNDAGSIWTTRNDVNGRLFGTAPHQIFLPAAGFRNINGLLAAVNSRGYYWSSTPSGTPNSMFLWLTSSDSWVSFGDRSTARSIRCVAE